MQPFVEETRTGIQGYGQEVPLGWSDFLRRVQKLSAAGTKRLSLDDVRKIFLETREVSDYNIQHLLNLKNRIQLPL